MSRRVSRHWTLPPGYEYTTRAMPTPKSGAKRKPPMRALSRRARAVVRSLEGGSKSLSQSDLEWRALWAAKVGQRKRRSLAGTR
jgi:hypothetical protein